MTFILALDQGTSSSRSVVLNAQGEIISMAQRELRQYFPQPGWVEHCPEEIWQSQLETAQQAIQQAGIRAEDIASIGITNQRETTILWDRRTGQVLHKAIVWQDRRAENYCLQWREQGLGPLVQERTGLVIDAYFSASKLRWLLDTLPGARQLAEQGHLACGTVDSWLLWKLSGGERHLTDYSNAARTMLFNIHTQQWDPDLLNLFQIPPSLLPQALPSSADYGYTHSVELSHAIPIRGVAGDQQSALFGQACFHPGMVKNTYGTGCFMLMHTGNECHPSEHGLLSTSAAQAQGRAEYALEGSVFIGGAVVQWLRDGLGAFEKSPQVEALAASVNDSQGVLFVPAFTGLGAPYWDAHARGTLTGITRGTSMAHIARAALDSIAYQSAMLLQAMQSDNAQSDFHPIQQLRVDGGACQNNLLMQFQADLLGIPVVRPLITETTVMGAAYLAGLGAGVYRDQRDIEKIWQVERVFEPQLSRDQAEHLMNQWERAVRQARTQ